MTKPMSEWSDEEVVKVVYPMAYAAFNYKDTETPFVIRDAIKHGAHSHLPIGLPQVDKETAWAHTRNNNERVVAYEQSLISGDADFSDKDMPVIQRTRDVIAEEYKRRTEDQGDPRTWTDENFTKRGGVISGDAGVEGGKSDVPEDKNDWTDEHWAIYERARAGMTFAYDADNVRYDKYDHQLLRLQMRIDAAKGSRNADKGDGR